MFGRKKEKHHTSEREFIGEQSLRQQRLDHELDTLLDQLLRLFPSVPGLMAEILVPSGGNAQLITARIRPDESVALPIRVRRGEGTIGALFQSGQPFAGSRSDAGRISHSGSRGDVTHLLRTRSLLVIPISSHHRALGVLNLESPRDNTFTRDSLALVQESAAYKSLVDHLTTMTLETLSDDEIARNLVGKLRQQVAFAIDPSDLDSTYYQILQAAAQIINAPDISAGLVLVRDDSQRLAPVAGSRTNSPKQLWAVLASKLGAFNPDPAEWKLEAFSIAGRVIEQRQSELIPNVDGYPGYRDSGTGYKESSELIVPLVDGDHALGVIGLVSPALNTFTKTDQQHVEEIAKIAVYAIKRGEDILAAKRSELQLRLADELNEDFKQFFPPNVEAIRDLNIRDIRNRMYDKILRWAREHADADHAAIVLPEIVRDTQTNTQNEAQPHSTSLTYLTVHRDNGEHLDTAPPRWLATEGVTGRAYSSGGTAEEPEIAKKSGSTAVVEYYIDAASEVAAPMKRGDEVIGVLDVESKKDHHFTTAHIRWVEFLARQTALVLIAAELALKTQLELKLERLARDTDRVSQEIREADLDKVRKEVRDPQLLKILTEVCEITGSSVGRILIAMNAYKSPADDAIDVATGVLYFMVSTDPSETASDSVRYFPISEGASGTAFRQSREIIFRDEFSREEANYSRRSRDSLSGMILPIFEGSRIVGVVGFEADRKDAYTPDYALVGRRAAAMISRLLVVARLRISRSTTRMLRDFESSMLQLENKTIETFMEEVLQRTALLSDIKDGWGQLILLRPSTDSTTLIADRIFGATYQKDAVSDDTVSNFDPGTSDTREEILGSAFREAIIEQRPVLVLDVSHASTDFHLPRPAQSFICVPLLRPNEITYPSEVDATPALTTQSATVERAIGLLVVASPSRSEFSEADKEILTPFTQTIVYGLQTLALLGSREELMTELSHDFTTAYPSLQGSIRNVQAPLDAALGSEDIATVHHYIRSVNGQIRQLRSLVRLTQNMLRWFFDLARDDIRSDEVATDLANQQLSGEHQLEVIAGRSDHLSTEQILRDIQEPVTTLAELRREGFSIKWEHPAPPLYVATSRDDANLIAAVLFKFLDNAIKKTEKNDITVTCTQDQSGMNEPSVVFRVTNSGRPIDKLDRPLLFRLRFRPGSRHGSGSTGIGLYQARMIARKLGGDVGYETDEVDRNTFWFSLPARGDAD